MLRTLAMPLERLPIASWGFASVLAAAAGLVLLIALLGWRRRRLGRRGRRRLLMPAGLLVVLTAATCLNAWFDAYPQLASFSPTAGWGVVQAAHPVPRNATTEGAIQTLRISGPASGFGTHLAYTYLPPQYFTEPTRRFPVLILLHGSPGRPADWLSGGRAAQAGRRSAALGAPIIIVMPTASRSWLDDSECVNSRSEQIETYLTDDVVHGVQNSLRTLSGRNHWGVAGMSAGGFCALNLGLRDRSVFSAVLDLSGLSRPTHTGGQRVLFGSGRRGIEAADANDPAYYVHTLSSSPRTHIWFIVGTHDTGPRNDIRALAPQLSARGVDVKLSMRPGHHTYRVWAPGLNDELPAIARLLGGPSVPIDAAGI